MEEDPPKQLESDKTVTVTVQRTDMQVDDTSQPNVKEAENPKRRFLKIVQLCFGVIDMLAAIAIIVIGALHNQLCSVITPLFLVIGGAVSVLVDTLLIINAIYQFKKSLICGHIIILFLLILKFGSYLAGALIAWLFWDWTTCAPQLYYTAAILVPLCDIIAIMQFFIFTKL